MLLAQLQSEFNVEKDIENMQASAATEYEFAQRQAELNYQAGIDQAGAIGADAFGSLFAGIGGGIMGAVDSGLFSFTSKNPKGKRGRK